MAIGLTAIEFTVNGERRRIDAPPRRTLLEVLREDLGLTGTKYGCGEGDCRACAVLVGGEALPSCQIAVADIAGKDVRTIEGLARDGALHAVQRAFIDAGAMQCGYCVPGMILTAVALLEKTPRPTDAEIIDGMNGNICRCAGYENLLAAVRLACGRKEDR